jgi:DNA-binding transcriptional MocR family regulator
MAVFVKIVFAFLRVFVSWRLVFVPPWKSLPRDLAFWYPAPFMPYAANRLKYLQESVIRSITRYAIEKGAVLLAQGFPDFDPPAEVIAAAEEAMRQGCNQYGMTWGQPTLRKAISDKSRRFYGQSVDPERHVTVTCGHRGGHRESGRDCKSW